MKFGQKAALCTALVGASIAGGAVDDPLLSTSIFTFGVEPRPKCPSSGFSGQLSV